MQPHSQKRRRPFICIEKRPVKASCMLARLGLCSRPVSGWVFFDVRGTLGTLLMAGVAQLVRAPVCGTGGRRFKTGHSPHFSLQLMGKTGVFGRAVEADERRCLNKQMENVRAWRNW